VRLPPAPAGRTAGRTGLDRRPAGRQLPPGRLRAARAVGCPGVEQPQRRRRTTFTGRAALLALVGCALALSLAYPIQRYADQRQQIAALQDEVTERAQRVQVLEQQQQRWGDPAFVRQEARRRLHFVMPGETGYVLIGPAEDTADDGTAAGTGGSSVRDGEARRSWYDRLWASIGSAAQAPVDDGAAPARKPATHIGPGPDSSKDSGEGSGADGPG
jgi:cell division protein FtsB